MAIFKIYKDGVKEVISQKSSRFTYIPNGKTKSVSIQRVMYKHEHWMPPAFVNIEDKRYILPTWKEVHPDTTFEDVFHIKPERKKPVKETKTFPSKSDPSVTYKATVTTYPSGEVKMYCNCPGKWRAKSGMCKHLKSF